MSDEVHSVLSEIRTDVKWIKEKVDRQDDRLQRVEGKVHWFGGVGAVIGAMFGGLVTWITRTHS